MCCLKDKMTECYQVQKTNKKDKTRQKQQQQKKWHENIYSVTENITAKDHLVG